MSALLTDNCIFYIGLKAEGIISTDDYILFFVPILPIWAPPLPVSTFPLDLSEEEEKGSLRELSFNQREISVIMLLLEIFLLFLWAQFQLLYFSDTWKFYEIFFFQREIIYILSFVTVSYCWTC